MAVPSTAEAYRAQMPISREGQPDEVTAMVLTLLGDRAAWVTGQCIGVDGGNALRAAPDFSSMFGTAVPLSSNSRAGFSQGGTRARDGRITSKCIEHCSQQLGNDLCRAFKRFCRLRGDRQPAFGAPLKPAYL